jgi:MinD-like ATPase involved in chromosome partitioning or flagellar assembly
MTDDRNGQVVTFYSFKGGTGRTMALANVAWILAENGNRVLVVDWDLESPGLHRFFNPFLDSGALAQTGGIIDMIRAFEAETTTERDRPRGWEAELARVERFAFSLDYPFASGGGVDFLSAGRQNQDYKAGVSGLDWDVFYDRLGGAALFDALREDMKHNYDYALIDSRTGLSDIADICTIHLPDVLVDCFTFSEQGIDGAATVAHRVAGTYRRKREIRVLPVPMRVDLAEKDKADAGRTHAMRQFAGLPTGLAPAERQRYWSDVEVPYHAYYAYEETLATFGDRPGARGSLLSAYEKLASAITGQPGVTLPAMDESLRIRWRARFERRRVVPHEEITLWYAPRDQAWAEWIQRVLTLAGVHVTDPWTAGPPASPRTGQPEQVLAIVSQAYPQWRGTGGSPWPQVPLAVYVDDVQPLPELPAESSVFLDGLRADAATARVLRLVGRDAPPGIDATAARGARYPGAGPDLLNVPVANPQFTGRDDDLRRLRGRLRSGGAAGTSMVVLHGLGGVGKTQVALEYVHRFRSAYDLVWWIAADPSLFIDAALTDLGERMGLPRHTNVLLSARAVLDALSRGETYARWLIVFDNAAEFDEIRDFLPQSDRGHLLVTSRNQSWGDSAHAIEIDVFDREESIEHLRKRVPGIADQDADRVADALGDLPIALAVGGALLAASGSTLTVEQIVEEEASIEAVWDLSLRRLHDESPAAYRLLEVCSVLAPEIALDLLNSAAVWRLLRRHDRSVPSRSGTAKLIQQVNKLALIKLDTGARIQVHRLLQGVVRNRMGPEALAATRQQVESALAAARPEADIDNADAWGRYRMLWPHLEASDAAMRSALDSDDPAVLELLVDRLRYVWLRGTLDQGDDLAQRIDRAWSARIAATVDPDERDLLRVPLLRLRFNHGNILRELGHFDRSHRLDEVTRAEQIQLLGAEHPDTLMTAGGLGADLRALGHYGQALDLDRATHASWSHEFGDDYPRTLAALNNLATSLRLHGMTAEARERDELALERRQIVLGRTHFFTLFSAGALARDLREAGEYERSIALLRDVAAGYLATRGPGAVATLNSQTNLAVSLRSAGRAEEAAGLLETAYHGLRHNLGANSPDTLACRLNRAMNLLAVGDAATADAEAGAVHEAYTDLLGPRHPHTLTCVNNLAAVARARGDLRQALARAETAAGGLAEVLHAEHPFVLAALMNLAICRAESGQTAAALALAERLQDKMIKVLGASHPDALRCVADLGLIRVLAGDRDAASIEAPAGLVELTAALGVDHPTVRALRERRLLHRVVDPHPF